MTAETTAVALDAIDAALAAAVPARSFAIAGGPCTAPGRAGGPAGRGRDDYSGAPGAMTTRSA